MHFFSELIIFLHQKIPSTCGFQVLILFFWILLTFVSIKNESMNNRKLRKKPEKCITVEQGRRLVKEWCDTRTPEIDKCLGFVDAREFEWTVEELMEYLRYVKRESKKQGIIDPGVRVYLGAYPKEKCKSHRGYSTVFLAPTGHPARSLGKDMLRLDTINYKIAPYNHGNSGEPPKNY